METVEFEWEGERYSWDGRFPVVVYGPGGKIREATIRDHYHRLDMVRRGVWKREYQIGRKSPLKPWFFEWTHALKNVFVEELRYFGVWNRGDRDPLKPDGYVFPLSDLPD